MSVTTFNKSMPVTLGVRLWFTVDMVLEIVALGIRKKLWKRRWIIFFCRKKGACTINVLNCMIFLFQYKNEKNLLSINIWKWRTKELIFFLEFPKVKILHGFPVPCVYWVSKYWIPTSWTFYRVSYVYSGLCFVNIFFFFSLLGSLYHPFSLLSDWPFVTIRNT